MDTPATKTPRTLRKTLTRVGGVAAAGALAVGGSLAVLPQADALPGYDSDKYYLPFYSGNSYEVTQSPGDTYSHNDEYNMYAWDFAMAPGEQVYTSKAGTVVHAGWSNVSPLNGIEVMVDHGGNTCSQYLHLSGVTVEAGQQIDLGTQVGEAGATGEGVTGSHLHYSLVDCDTRVGIESTFAEGSPKTGEMATAL